MAFILKIGVSWRAQIRRKGQKAITGDVPNKALATNWARQIKAEMNARKFKDVRGLANITLKELIERYEEEISGQKPYEKKEAAVLNVWKRDNGSTAIA